MDRTVSATFRYRGPYLSSLADFAHCIFPKFDQCQMLQLQLYVLLMMGGVTARNI